MATTNPLSHELGMYQRLKDEWIAENDGKFVLIHKDDAPTFWETYRDALNAGYQKFGMESFLVKQLRGTEQVQFISRNLVPCPR